LTQVIGRGPSGSELSALLVGVGLLLFFSQFAGDVQDALLAQSVAHFHGKEKVVGSIPTEGSTVSSGPIWP
jgi:hypothetical protein